jgi:site-specific recombinase XerD
MIKDNHPLFDHLINFLEYLAVEKGLSNKTQENYKMFLHKFFEWLNENNLNALKPHELTDDHIWKYRVWLSRSFNKIKKTPLKKSTQNYYLIALRSFLVFFTDRNILSLPAEKIKLAKDKDERAVKFLNLDQVEKLLAMPKTETITGLRDRAILEALFSTGLRVAELNSINRDQVKMKKETKDLEISITGKGGRTRTVYFSDRAVVHLKNYLNKRTDNEKALFINYRGPKMAVKRLTSRSVENLVKKYALLAGISVLTTPHVLRHSFATDLLMQGVDLRTVQEFLGHKNITTTQIYTHVTNQRLRDIHRKFHGGKKI